jgi:hypothetical protein
MSARLIATQLAGVTMGVVGAGLIVSTINKAARSSSPRRTYMYDKLERFTSQFEEPKLLKPITVPEPVVYYTRPVVFDDNFVNEPFY